MAGEVDELIGAQERLIVAQKMLSTSEVAERDVLRKRMEAAKIDRAAALTAVKDAAKAGDPEAVAAIDFFEKKTQRDASRKAYNGGKLEAARVGRLEALTGWKWKGR